MRKSSWLKHLFKGLFLKNFTVSFNSESKLHKADTWYPPQDIILGFNIDILLRNNGCSQIFLLHSGIWPYLLHPHAYIFFVLLIAYVNSYPTDILIIFSGISTFLNMISSSSFFWVIIPNCPNELSPAVNTIPELVNITEKFFPIWKSLIKIFSLDFSFELSLINSSMLNLYNFFKLVLFSPPNK